MMLRRPGKRATSHWAGYLISMLNVTFTGFCEVVAAERPDAESPRKAKQTTRTTAF